MPRLTVYAVRAALVYLAVGFTLGALMLANKGVPFGAWAWSLLPAHIEFLLVGWMAQLALGVAFWILPRYMGGSRGNQRPAWAAIVLLNLGVLVASLTALGWGWALLPGRLLEVAAALLFALYAWGRVKPAGK